MKIECSENNKNCLTEGDEMFSIIYVTNWLGKRVALAHNMLREDKCRSSTFTHILIIKPSHYGEL